MIISFTCVFLLIQLRVFIYTQCLDFKPNNFILNNFIGFFLLIENTSEKLKMIVHEM